jgi:hypothetical protein
VSWRQWQRYRWHLWTASPVHISTGTRNSEELETLRTKFSAALPLVDKDMAGEGAVARHRHTSYDAMIKTCQGRCCSSSSSSRRHGRGGAVAHHRHDKDMSDGRGGAVAHHRHAFGALSVRQLPKPVEERRGHRCEARATGHARGDVAMSGPLVPHDRPRPPTATPEKAALSNI